MYSNPVSDPKNWENYFKDVLRKYYGPSNMKDIPDSYGGDFGIECYSFSGHVFQCYLPEETSDKKKITKLIKNKIRKDIHKIVVKNIKEFERLFEGMNVSRWVLLTPQYVDSDIAVYCSAKSAKVRRMGLSYISDDFQITVQTEADYKAEVKSLRQSVYQLSLMYDPVGNSDAETWIDSNVDFLSKLNTKLPKVVDKDKVLAMKSFLAQKYLEYQNLLDYLISEWPEIHRKISDLIDNRRSYLESRFLTDSGKQPDAVIKGEIIKLKDDICNEIETIKTSDLELIVWGVVADWMIRCPLDF